MTTTVDLPAPPPPAAPPQHGRSRRLTRGRDTDPAWVRPALLALLAATGLLYLWDLGASGWGNSFYAAAVQAGTQSWKAFFFGSSDAANFITVDKTPASMWVMELSARVFGVNSWSVLAPQALEGVAAVGVLYATVRRWFSPAAALLAGAVLALTPVATLMFRFNNPDALLVLLLVIGAYAMTRAVERGRTGWLVLAATCVGFGFLTKMMQAFVVVPVFAVVYLLAAPTSLRRRIGQLAIAGVALFVASSWWVAIVELIPAADRPYIGGSQTNSVLNLIFGYNGFGRLTGNETGSVGLTPGGTGMWGPTGWNRLFTASMGGQVSWLIPAALILGAALLWLTRRAPRTDRVRAAVLLWGGWLLLTGGLISFAKGIIHPYYTVALAPAIGALVGIGATGLWRLRRQIAARVVLAAALSATVVWSFILLNRSPSWYPWLRYAVLAGGLLLAVVLVSGLARSRRLGIGVAVSALLLGLAAPAAYALDTAALRTNASSYRWVDASVGSNTASGYQLGSGQPVMAIGGFNGTAPTPTLAQFQQYVAAGQIHYFIAGGGFGPASSTGTGTAITSWVSAHYAARTIGGVTMYDLTPAGASG